MHKTCLLYTSYSHAALSTQYEQINDHLVMCGLLSGEREKTDKQADVYKRQTLTRMLLMLRLLPQNTLIRFAAAGTPAQTRIMIATRLSRTGSRLAVRVICGIHKRTDITI